MHSILQKLLFSQNLTVCSAKPAVFKFEVMPYLTIKADVELKRSEVSYYCNNIQAGTVTQVKGQVGSHQEITTSMHTLLRVEKLKEAQILPCRIFLSILFSEGMAGASWWSVRPTSLLFTCHGDQSVPINKYSI